MKLLIENWKKYINEATEDTMTDLVGYDNNSFQDVFSSLSSSGDRAIISYVPTDLDTMNQLLSRSANSIEIEKKTTEKANREIVNSVPVINVTSFKSSFNQETRKRYLGKKVIKKMNLEKFVNQYKKAADNIPQIMAAIETMDHNRLTGVLESFIGFFNKDFRPTGEPRIDLQTIVGNLDIVAIQKEADELVKLFAKNKRELTGRSTEWPSDTSDVAFILTRFPEDVIRMSDFPALRSCHSLDSDYRHCVLADSTEGGAVIYSVLKSDFKGYYGLELNQASLDKYEGKEIFKDIERKGVEGVEPTGRVRVRKILVQGKEFAVIENAVYGSFPVGSRDRIFQTLIDIQRSKFNQLTQPVDLKNQAVSHGGSYADTSFDKMIQEMFDALGIKYTNSIEKHKTNEEDFVINSLKIYNSIQRGDEDMHFTDKGSNNEIISQFYISEDDGSGYYEYFSLRTVVTLDISSIAPQIDLDKLQDFLQGFYARELKNFDRFSEYFPGIYNLRVSLKRGSTAVVFENGYSNGSTDNLVDDFHQLEQNQISQFQYYKSTLGKIKNNPEILKEIFHDFLKPEALRESKSHYKIKIKG